MFYTPAGTPRTSGRKRAPRTPNPRDTMPPVASGGTNPPSTSGGAKGYPSTPHLPFSPGVQADDIKLDDCTWLVGSEVVVTEKLDGGNCCLWRGGVYARTHAHEATHPWFASIKALYPSFAASVDDDLMLFGENMSAVHSVEYDRLGAHFYLFGVRRLSTGEWLAWDEVT